MSYAALHAFGATAAVLCPSGWEPKVVVDQFMCELCTGPVCQTVPPLYKPVPEDKVPYGPIVGWTILGAFAVYMWVRR